MMIEQRLKDRAITTFKSAYVKTSDGVHFVTVRNISEGGACLETYPGVAEGDCIELHLDAAGSRKAIVMWVGEGRFGVQIDPVSVPQGPHSMSHISRSIRLPLSISANVFLHGIKAQGAIKNLSLRGACISGLEGLRPGQLITIEIGGTDFEQATVRWSHNGEAGVAFARPMRRTEFRKLVDALHGRFVMSPSHEN